MDLSPAMQVSLFNKSLISPGGTDKVEDQHTAPIKNEDRLTTGSKPPKYLGNNQRHLLIITSSPEVVFLPDDELAFLTGILGACKLSLADVAIVNLHQYPGCGFKEITSFIESRVTMLFGIEPAALGLPVSFPHYQLQAFADTTFLYAPRLKQLENDKLEKSKLWVCLKKLFNL